MADWLPSPTQIWTLLGPQQAAGFQGYSGTVGRYGGYPGMDLTAPGAPPYTPPIGIAPPPEEPQHRALYTPDQIAAMEASLSSQMGGGGSPYDPTIIDMGPAATYDVPLPQPGAVATPDYSAARALMAQGAPGAYAPPPNVPYPEYLAPPGYDESQWGDDKLMGILSGLARGAMSPASSNGNLLLNLAAGALGGYGQAWDERQDQEHEAALREWDSRSAYDQNRWQADSANADRQWQAQQDQAERTRAYLLDQANLEMQIGQGEAEATNKTRANEYESQLQEWQRQKDEFDRAQPVYHGSSGGYATYEITQNGRRVVVQYPQTAYWNAKAVADTHGAASPLAVNAFTGTGDPTVMKQHLGAIMFGLVNIPQAVEIRQNTLQDQAIITQMAQLDWSRNHEGRTVEPGAYGELGPDEGTVYPPTITSDKDVEEWQRTLISAAAAYFVQHPDRYGQLLTILGADGG